MGEPVVSVKSPGRHSCVCCSPRLSVGVPGTSRKVVGSNTEDTFPNSIVFCTMTIKNFLLWFPVASLIWRLKKCKVQSKNGWMQDGNTKRSWSADPYRISAVYISVWESGCRSGAAPLMWRNTIGCRTSTLSRRSKNIRAVYGPGYQIYSARWLQQGSLGFLWSF